MSTVLPDSILSGKQAAKVIGIKNPNTLHVWRCHGRGPRFVRVGRAIRYRLSDLQAYIESCVETPGQPRRRRKAA
jgi:hypothetical protein